MKIIAQDKKTAGLLAVFFSVALLLAVPSRSETLAEFDGEIAAIVERVTDLVVTVEARGDVGMMPRYPTQTNRMTDPVEAVVGSGLIIDTLGHILTILPLVDGYDHFIVTVGDNDITARLAGVDRRLNLAVLKLDSVLFPDHLPIPSRPEVGRMALAYGRAIGRTGYPSLGIIAGQQSDGSYLFSGSGLPGILGGGVFDLTGHLIGVISSGSIGGSDSRDKLWGGIVMLPAGVALTAAERIIRFGNRDAGYLGVRTTAIELVSDNGTVLGEAVVISAVDPRSPAAASGLRPGDIITHLAQRRVTTDNELQRMTAAAGSDSTITLRYIRGRKTGSLSVALAPMPGGFMIQAQNQSASDSGKDLLMAMEIQKRIDAMRVEMVRMQRELENLLARLSSSR